MFQVSGRQEYKPQLDYATGETEESDGQYTER